MRKSIILAAFAAFVGIAAAMAQQIAVVSESGATSVYQTLQEAIEEANPGSVIYLPGGGFQIDDSVKITKRLSIIGIGHKAKNENADGNTTISGNLFFNEGSSGSSIMGCYISGNVNISSSNNVTVKYCNLNRLNVSNNTCKGTFINQNYIRSSSTLGYSEVTFHNNICGSILYATGSNFYNNIFAKCSGSYLLYKIESSTFINNIFLYVSSDYFSKDLSDNLTSGNMRKDGTFGDDPIKITAAWADVFTKYNGGSISPASDFHFKPEFQQYSDCGIYGGTGFSDGALPPVPFIVSKSIPEQTDASGKLNIKIRVKAGE